MAICNSALASSPISGVGRPLLSNDQYLWMALGGRTFPGMIDTGACHRRADVQPKVGGDGRKGWLERIGTAGRGAVPKAGQNRLEARSYTTITSSYRGGVGAEPVVGRGLGPGVAVGVGVGAGVGVAMINRPPDTH
jgi:hypothetical protein